MIRMNERVLRGFTYRLCDAWSMTRARNLWRYAIHVARMSDQCYPQRIAHLARDVVIDPVSLFASRRSRGRPRQRWDDKISEFCKQFIDGTCGWIDVLSQHDGNCDIMEYDRLYYIQYIICNVHMAASHLKG